MRELPILFSTEMVKAILDRRKTQTRRTWLLTEFEESNEQQGESDWDIYQLKNGKWRAKCEAYEGYYTVDFNCPYGQPGDLLYVRETWRMTGWNYEDGQCLIEYADGCKMWLDVSDDEGKWLVKNAERLIDGGYFDANDNTERMEPNGKPIPFKPSIHLPKWASRIWLKVTDIRVERLQDITQEDALAEGVDCIGHRPASSGCKPWKNVSLTRDCFVCAFKVLWMRLNGLRGFTWDANPWVWVISFEVVSTTGKPVKIESKEMVV